MHRCCWPLVLPCGRTSPAPDMPAPSSSSRREGHGWRPALIRMLRLHLGDSAACLAEHLMEHVLEQDIGSVGPEIKKGCLSNLNERAQAWRALEKPL